ncbi:MAG: hypothetical protein WDM92_06340 [Caulobacteraceae bacterium]
MILLSSHVAVTGAIDTFNLTYGAALPDAVRELLATALGGGSPVDRMCQAAEVLYANRAAITDTAAKAAAMTLAAPMRRLGRQSGQRLPWHGRSRSGWRQPGRRHLLGHAARARRDGADRHELARSLGRSARGRGVDPSGRRLIHGDPPPTSPLRGSDGSIPLPRWRAVAPDP